MNEQDSVTEIEGELLGPILGAVAFGELRQGEKRHREARL